MVSNIFYFHPYLGEWSNLTNIFQMGWNHQLDNMAGKWTRKKWRFGQLFPERKWKWFLLIEHSHTIHVYYIYLLIYHKKSTKCRQICHTWILWDNVYVCDKNKIDLPYLQVNLAGQCVFNNLTGSRASFFHHVCLAKVGTGWDLHIQDAYFWWLPEPCNGE